jgi:hypothetical protein
MSKESNLTNACSMISFMIAQWFLATTGKPTSTQLCTIIRTSAPRMRVLRGKLGFDEDKLDEVDLHDLRRIIQAWYLGDQDSFDSTIPNMIRDKFMQIRTVDEIIVQSIPSLPGIKKAIEGVIVRNPRCAVSITFNAHTITGCFDIVVSSLPIFMNNPKPKANGTSYLFLLQGQEKLFYRLALRRILCFWAEQCNYATPERPCETKHRRIDDRAQNYGKKRYHQLHAVRVLVGRVQAIPRSRTSTRPVHDLRRERQCRF